MSRPTPNPEQHSALADLINDLADDAVFSSTSGQAFVSIPIGSFHQTLALSDPRFHDWLISRFHTRTGAPLAEHARRLIVRTLRARAHCAGRRHIVAVRAAGGAGARAAIYVDLCNANGEAVAIDELGWRITTAPEVMFQSTRGQLPLPRPETGDFDYAPLNSAPIRAWAQAALQPHGPYPVLILQGPPAGGKTTTARFLRSLLDPVIAPLHPLPSRGSAVMELAARSRVLAFDHVTRMSNSVADAICRISSGTCIAIREPGDRRDALHLDVARPVILTASEDWKPRPDLASRAVTIHLDPIDPGNRRTAAGLQTQFGRACPAILAGLYTDLAASLRNPDGDPPAANHEPPPPNPPDPLAAIHEPPTVTPPAPPAANHEQPPQTPPDPPAANPEQPAPNHESGEMKHNRSRFQTPLTCYHRNVWRYRMGPLGVQEMIVIFLVALVLFGPKKLPELGRTIGKAITEFRRAQSELKATFEHHMKELEKENESIKEVTQSYTNEVYNHYDSSQYDSPYYDSGAYGNGSYDYNSQPAESNPSTVGATATQVAESTDSHEASGNGTVPRSNTSESGNVAEHHATGQPAPEHPAAAPERHPSPESAAS